MVVRQCYSTTVPGKASDTGKALLETLAAIKELEEEETFFKELEEESDQAKSFRTEGEADQELKIISSPFGVDEDRDMNTDQSANQEDAEVGTPRAKEEVEEVSGSLRIKGEPGTQSLVIMAEACRKFLAENTCLGKKPIKITPLMKGNT